MIVKNDIPFTTFQGLQVIVSIADESFHTGEQIGIGLAAVEKRTLCPRAKRYSTIGGPIKPVPPSTSTFMGDPDGLTFPPVARAATEFDNPRAAPAIADVRIKFRRSMLMFLFSCM